MEEGHQYTTWAAIVTSNPLLLSQTAVPASLVENGNGIIQNPDTVTEKGCTGEEMEYSTKHKVEENHICSTECNTRTEQKEVDICEYVGIRAPRVKKFPAPVAIYFANVKSGKTGALRRALKARLPERTIWEQDFVGTSILEVVVPSGKENVLIEEQAENAIGWAQNEAPAGLHDKRRRSKVLHGHTAGGRIRYKQFK